MCIVYDVHVALPSTLEQYLARRLHVIVSTSVALERLHALP